MTKDEHTMLSVNDIVDALRNDDPSTAFYYDRAADTIVSIYTPNGVPDSFELRPDLFVPLPVLYEEDRDEIVDRFIQTLDLEPSILITLSDAPDSARQFKELVARDPEIAQQWNAYYTQSLSSIARQWCDENDIEYMERVGGETNSPGDPVELVPELPDSDSKMMAIGLIQAIRHLHRTLDAEAFEAALNDIQDKIAEVQ